MLRRARIRRIRVLESLQSTRILTLRMRCRSGSVCPIIGSVAARNSRVWSALRPHNAGLCLPGKSRFGSNSRMRLANGRPRRAGLKRVKAINRPALAALNRLLQGVDSFRIVESALLRCLASRLVDWM